jgi:O-antigen/teichoic acid export membrane protein
LAAKQAPKRGGSLVLVIVRVASFSLTGIGFIVFARVMHPLQYGEYSAAQSIVTTITVLQFLGLDQLYFKRRIDDDGLDVAATQVVAVTMTLVLLASAFWPNLSHDERLCVLLLGLTTAVDLLKIPWLLRPALALDFSRRAYREAGTRSLRVVLLIGVVFVVHRAVPLAVVGLVLMILILLPTEGRIVHPRRIVTREAIDLLRESLPFALSSLLFTVYFSIDAALLASLRPATEVAFYRAAYNLVQAAAVLPVVLNADIMRPRLYALGHAGVSRRRPLVRFGAITLGLGVTAGVFLAVISHPLVSVMYGHEYAPAGALLALLALALPFHYATGFLTNALLAFDKVRLVIAVQGSLAILNVAGNLVLIPSEGAHGAAVMTLVTEAAGAVFMAWTAIVAVHYRKKQGA